MFNERPIVLSIAGFDPTGGAGVLADVKTFEMNSCIGFGVLTANTIQVEDEFMSADWQTPDKILEQLNPLLNKYDISAVKIGLIENMDTLSKVCQKIKNHSKAITIVWDSVLSASSGFELLKVNDRNKLFQTLDLIDLVTPNANELLKLADVNNEDEALEILGNHCAVLLKGGHRKQNLGTDVLLIKKVKTEIPACTDDFYPKHGTGCILSSAITCQLAQGKPMQEACFNAKTYLIKTANSNPQLLAYHHV